jgi:hypothetical protein
MSRFTSREFLIAAVLALVGVVKLFVDVPDSVTEQVTAVVVAVVPAVAFIIMRVVQKIKETPPAS